MDAATVAENAKGDESRGTRAEGGLTSCHGGETRLHDGHGQRARMGKQPSHLIGTGVMVWEM